eukprot:m.1309607 g.1309607  ORF g.1309607 m.1309607 type:complete len:411 (-) comp24824_c0_seq28:4163-5395(-)
MQYTFPVPLEHLNLTECNGFIGCTHFGPCMPLNNIVTSHHFRCHSRATDVNFCVPTSHQTIYRARVSVILGYRHEAVSILSARNQDCPPSNYDYANKRLLMLWEVVCTLLTACARFQMNRCNSRTGYQILALAMGMYLIYHSVSFGAEAGGLLTKEGACDSSTNDYRLSDCIHLPAGFEKETFSKCNKSYPNSLCAYFWGKQSNLLSSNRELSRDEPQRRATFSSVAFCNAARDFSIKVAAQPFEDNFTIVIHLRLGDVIAGNRESVDTMWEVPQPHFVGVDSQWNFYVKTKYYFEAIRAQIPSYVNAVHLVGNVFHGNTKKIQVDIEKNLRYLLKVQHFFLSQKYEVRTTMRHKSNVAHQKNSYDAVDNDFISMMQAPHFAPTGGGFSRLIARCSTQCNFGAVYLSDVK